MKTRGGETPWKRRAEEEVEAASFARRVDTLHKVVQTAMRRRRAVMRQHAGADMAADKEYSG